MASISSCPVRLRKSGGRNVWGRRLTSGFCTANVIELRRHESQLGSRGAELRSLHDRHPQSHNLRWIDVSERDCSERCNASADGTVVIIKQLWPAWVREWRMCAQGDKIHPWSREKPTYPDFRRMGYQRQVSPRHHMICYQKPKAAGWFLNFDSQIPIWSQFAGERQEKKKAMSSFRTASTVQSNGFSSSPSLTPFKSHLKYS